MSLSRIFDIAGSAVSAQSQRLNVVASNLANADTVAGPDGSSYKARQVVFQTATMGAAAVRDADLVIEAVPEVLRPTKSAGPPLERHRNFGGARGGHADFDDRIPYAVAFVLPVEDPDVRFVTRIVDCDFDRLAIGMPVRIAFTDVGGVAMPFFRPA